MNFSTGKKKYFFFTSSIGNPVYYVTKDSKMERNDLINSFELKQKVDKDWFDIDFEDKKVNQLVCPVKHQKTSTYIKSNHKFDGKILKIASSNDHTLILTSECVYGAGSNKQGQLSLTNTPKNAELIKPTRIVHLKKFNKIVNVFCGNKHSLFLSVDGSLFASGYNSPMCVLGVGTKKKDILMAKRVLIDDKVIDVVTGFSFIMMLTEFYEVFQAGLLEKNLKSKIPVKIKFPEKIIKISCGAYHVVALGESKKLYGLGSNRFFQQIMNNKYDYKTPVHMNHFDKFKIENICCGFFYTLVFTSKNEVWGVGMTRYGQMGEKLNKGYTGVPILLKKNVERIECGTHFTYLFTKNNLWVSGYNQHSSMGLMLTKDNEDEFGEKMVKKFVKVSNLNLNDIKMYDTSPKTIFKMKKINFFDAIIILKIGFREL